MTLRCLLVGVLAMVSVSFGCAARDGRGGWARRPMAIGALSGLRFVHVSNLMPERREGGNLLDYSQLVLYPLVFRA